MKIVDNSIHQNYTQQILYDEGIHKTGKSAENMTPEKIRQVGAKSIGRKIGVLTVGTALAIVGSRMASQEKSTDLPTPKKTIQVVADQFEGPNNITADVTGHKFNETNPMDRQIRDQIVEQKDENGYIQDGQAINIVVDPQVAEDFTKRQQAQHP